MILADLKPEPAPSSSDRHRLVLGSVYGCARWIPGKERVRVKLRESTWSQLGDDPKRSFPLGCRPQGKHFPGLLFGLFLDLTCFFLDPGPTFLVPSDVFSWTLTGIFLDLELSFLGFFIFYF